MVDEYEEIQKLRQLWSRAIMTWNQIMIPLCAAIITFFVTQLREFHFLLFGWALLTAIVIYWRLSVYQIDHNIVGMYRRMLELEKENGMEIQADYYFRHLKRKYKRNLAKELGVQRRFCLGEIKNYDLKDFKNKLKEKKKEKPPIDYLLEILGTFKWKSVTGRGHGIQNWAPVILLILFLIGILVCHYNPRNIWTLLLILLG